VPVLRAGGRFAISFGFLQLDLPASRWPTATSGQVSGRWETHGAHNLGGSRAPDGVVTHDCDHVDNSPESRA
jgi:hypothetical protein